MALRSESWVPQAKALHPGGKARVPHDCGPGNTLLIRNDETGLHAWCFRCIDKGWAPPPALPLEARLKALRQRSEEDLGVPHLPTELPAPAVPWSEWPATHRLWLLKAGLGAHDAARLGAYYHPPTDRVVLPVLEGPAPVFWQARAVLPGRVPKYLSPEKPAGGVLPRYGKADAVTLTEDILSAYKVGSTEGCEGWSLMGVSLKPHVLAALMQRKAKVNVWLDPDPPGQRAAAKAVSTVRAAGLEVRNIISDRDPKLLHRASIKELLA